MITLRSIEIGFTRTDNEAVNDQSASKTWLRALEATAPIAANPHRILPDVIEDLAETRGDVASTALDG